MKQNILIIIIAIVAVLLLATGAGYFLGRKDGQVSVNDPLQKKVDSLQLLLLQVETSLHHKQGEVDRGKDKIQETLVTLASERTARQASERKLREAKPKQYNVKEIDSALLARYNDGDSILVLGPAEKVLCVPLTWANEIVNDLNHGDLMAVVVKNQQAEIIILDKLMLQQDSVIHYQAQADSLRRKQADLFKSQNVVQDDQVEDLQKRLAKAEKKLKRRNKQLGVSLIVNIAQAARNLFGGL